VPKVSAEHVVEVARGMDFATASNLVKLEMSRPEDGRFGAIFMGVLSLSVDKDGNEPAWKWFDNLNDARTWMEKWGFAEVIDVPKGR
jgi:hypothetical protein